MMNRQNPPRWVPMVWLFSTVIWVLALCVDFIRQDTDISFIFMHALCLVCSLFSAVRSYGRYKKALEEQDEL